MSVREVRLEVFARDEGCVARYIDPDSGPCFDQWGFPKTASEGWAWADYEMDYVRLGASGKRHELAQDHVMLCPGHHRGTGPNSGHQWATAHRPQLRAYLDAKEGT